MRSSIIKPNKRVFNTGWEVESLVTTTTLFFFHKMENEKRSRLLLLLVQGTVWKWEPLIHEYKRFFQQEPPLQLKKSASEQNLLLAGRYI